MCVLGDWHSHDTGGVLKHGHYQQVGPAIQKKPRMEAFDAAESLPCTQDASWKAHPGVVRTMAMASTFILLQ